MYPHSPYLPQGMAFPLPTPHAFRKDSSVQPGMCWELDDDGSDLLNDTDLQIGPSRFQCNSNSDTVFDSNTLFINTKALSSPVGEDRPLAGEPNTVAKIRKPKATTKKAPIWEPYKNIVQDLYETHTVPELMSIMAERHNFHATKRQFRSQLTAWGNDKKVKTDEMRFMAFHTIQRRRVGKRPYKFTVRGKRVDQAKINRYLRTHKDLDYEQMAAERPSDVLYEVQSDDDLVMEDYTRDLYASDEPEEGDKLENSRKHRETISGTLDERGSYKPPCATYKIEGPTGPYESEDFPKLNEVNQPIEVQPLIEQGAAANVDSRDCVKPDEPPEILHSGSEEEQDLVQETNEPDYLDIIMTKFPLMTMEEILLNEEEKDMKRITSALGMDRSELSQAEPLPNSFLFRNPQHVLRRKHDLTPDDGNAQYGTIDPTFLFEGRGATTRLEIRYNEAQERSLRRELMLLYSTPESEMSLKIDLAWDYAGDLYDYGQVDVADAILRTALSTLGRGKNAQEYQQIVEMLRLVALIQWYNCCEKNAASLCTSLLAFAAEKRVLLSTEQRLETLRFRGPEMQPSESKSQFEDFLDTIGLHAAPYVNSIRAIPADERAGILIEIVRFYGDVLLPSDLMDEKHYRLYQAIDVSFCSSNYDSYILAYAMARLELNSDVGCIPRAELLAEYSMQGYSDIFGPENILTIRAWDLLSTVEEEKREMLKQGTCRCTCHDLRREKASEDTLEDAWY